MHLEYPCECGHRWDAHDFTVHNIEEDTYPGRCFTMTARYIEHKDFTIDSCHCIKYIPMDTLVWLEMKHEEKIKGLFR